MSSKQGTPTEAEQTARPQGLDALHTPPQEEDPYRHARAAGSMKDDPFWADVMQEIQDQRRRMDAQFDTAE